MCIYDAHGMGFRIVLALRAADIYDVTRKASYSYMFLYFANEPLKYYFYNFSEH